MATRQERMRDRMRGAGRHNVGDVDFGFVIPVAEEPMPDAAEEAEEQQDPATEPSPPTPNTGAERKPLDGETSRVSPARETAPPASSSHDVYSIPDASTEAGETAAAYPPSQQGPQQQQQQQEEAEEQAPTAEGGPEDYPMADAPPLPSSIASTLQQQQKRQRGPLDGSSRGSDRSTSPRRWR
ncbi:hypothetical protein VTH06DRAFT_4869 [Thermothelomyces fergusii]